MVSEIVVMEFAVAAEIAVSRKNDIFVLITLEIFPRNSWRFLQLQMAYLHLDDPLPVCCCCY